MSSTIDSTMRLRGLGLIAPPAPPTPTSAASFIVSWLSQRTPSVRVAISWPNCSRTLSIGWCSIETSVPNSAATRMGTSARMSLQLHGHVQRVRVARRLVADRQRLLERPAERQRLVAGTVPGEPFEHRLVRCEQRLVAAEGVSHVTRRDATRRRAGCAARDAWRGNRHADADRPAGDADHPEPQVDAERQLEHEARQRPGDHAREQCRQKAPRSSRGWRTP